MGFGKDGKGAIIKEDTSFTLGALAAQDVLATDSNVALDKDFRILKTELSAILTGVTSLEGAGLLLYMTEGDLTAAEIEENIELNGPVTDGDQEGQERASRWVRRVAVSSDDTVNNTERSMRGEGNSPLISLNPRWTFRRRRTSTEGGWNWAIYNDGVVLTTGTTVRVKATHYGVWVG